MHPDGVCYNGFINNPDSNPFREDKGENLAEKDTSLATGYNNFSRFIQFLESKNCKLIFVYPPTISMKSNDPVIKKTETYFQNLADQNHISLFHFDTDPGFTKNLFVDDIHLSLEGSVLYSKKIAKIIQALFPKK